jgi:hypothetical protein
MIELAGSMGLDAVLTHHPVADAANSGGVPLKPYLDLYDLALFELHEAFHGLHPGIAYLHGHRVLEADIHYAGIPGNILLYGEALPEVKTANDILLRLNTFMNLEVEKKILAAESGIRDGADLHEASVSACPEIMHGEKDTPVKRVLHIFPHTGFTSRHLESALERFPQTDTIIVSISRVRSDNDLVKTIREKGLTLVIGNSHAQEIYENGLPLACALQHVLPQVSIMMLRERVTATALERFGDERIRHYARRMADHILTRDERG